MTVLQGGLMPGQHHTPIRVGRDLHPLLALNEAAAGDGAAPGSEAAAAAAADSIGSRRVAGIAASKYFSVLRTSVGEVWTCGGESFWICSVAHLQRCRCTYGDPVLGTRNCVRPRTMLARAAPMVEVLCPHC